MDLACQRAIQDGCDSFGYDADGLGAALRDNVSKAFNGKRVSIYAYKGSSAMHSPDAVFKSETTDIQSSGKPLLNKDVLHTIRFYTKDELRKGVPLPNGARLKIPSPNLFDSAVISFDKSSIINRVQPRMPRSLNAMGRR
jgi:hypothetical protein